MSEFCKYSYLTEGKHLDYHKYKYLLLCMHIMYKKVIANVEFCKIISNVTSLE